MTKLEITMNNEQGGFDVYLDGRLSWVGMDKKGLHDVVDQVCDYISSVETEEA
jgi:hypothetical protein